MAEKVVLGLSDGVDSAVAARVLMDAGYEVYGLYLDIGGAQERADACASAEKLGIPLKVRDIHDWLETYVCAPFARAYLMGKTPNPCIGCNPNVKFRALLEEADAIGARWVATGHYARCDQKHIYMGAAENDQSYMLARLTAEQVGRLILPLGEYHKSHVREMAQEMGLAVADKPDSRENCFIKNMTYADWIARREKVAGPGPVRFRGEIIGTHAGIHCYTVGQRWPEMVGERRVYVSRINAEKNELEVCLWEDSFHRDFDIVDVTWIAGKPQREFRAAVRVRHTRWETPACTVTLTDTGAHICADEPLRAPARGQAAALYQGDMLLGGGYID